MVENSATLPAERPHKENVVKLVVGFFPEALTSCFLFLKSNHVILPRSLVLSLEMRRHIQ